MTPTSRAKGTSVENPASSPSTGLTFPAGLIHPPQSQLTRSEDAVGDRILQLDMWAQRLGEGFGIPFTTFALNPPPSIPNDGSTPVLAAVATMLTALAHRQERITVERRGGRWGLYFTREPAAFAQERKAEAVPLKDAPLDVRERFLLKSEEFFRTYLQVCADRLARMKGSVTQADRTIELLSQMRLE